MKKKVSILLVGIGGYGQGYVNKLLNYKGEEKFCIVGVVDPKPEGCKRLSEIKEINIPIFETMEDFYAGSSADLAVISSPIQYHREQTCFALEHGSNVFCEKPMCATVQESYEIMKARDESGKFAAVGYQWSFSDAIQELKRDIINGVFGRPKRLKTIVLWPRTYEYYSRNKWAGRKRDDKGNWVLDSVANNATAHYLHNMFYVLGDEIDGSARPESVISELYRANNIENFDTIAMKTLTEDGVELLFYATHAASERLGPEFCYEFEKANIMYQERDTSDKRNILAIFNDGKQKDYGDPSSDGAKKLWMTIDAVREGKSIPCGPEAAISQTLCINGAQESMPGIVDFPKSIINEDDNKKGIYVDGLSNILEDCYNQWKLPYEIGVSWAKSGRQIDLKGYRSFGGEI